MVKFKMVFWIEGLFECTQKEKGIEAGVATAAPTEAQKMIEELKNLYPLFDFGITKLIQIKESGEEVEIPLTL